MPQFTARYGRWIVAGVGIVAAYGLLRSPTVAAAVWLSIGVLVVMFIVGFLARLHHTGTSGMTA